MEEQKNKVIENSEGGEGGKVVWFGERKRQQAADLKEQRLRSGASLWEQPRWRISRLFAVRLDEMVWFGHDCTESEYLARGMLRMEVTGR